MFMQLDGEDRRESEAAAAVAAHRRELAAALGGLVLIGAYAVAAATGGAWLGPAAGLVWGVPLAAAAAGWVLWAGLHQQARGFWAAAALGLTAWAAPAVLLLPGMPLRWPGDPAGMAWLLPLALGCWMVALLRLFTLIPRRLSATGLADTGLLVACAIALSGYFVLGPLLATGGSRVDIVHTMTALGLFATLVGVRYLAAGPLPRGAALVVGAMAVALVADGRLLWAGLPGNAVHDAGTGALIIAAGLLFLAAVHSAIWPPALLLPSATWERYGSWLPLAGLGSVILLPLFRPPGGVWSDTVGLGVLLCLTLGVLRLGLALAETRRLLVERSALLWEREEYARQAVTDPLTGLFNKGYCAERLAAEWAHSRATGQPFTLVALDLDNFKSVNDGRGHAAGDALLRDIGRALQAGCRATDIPCRNGGDEFAILCPATAPADGVRLAERLRAAVAAVLVAHDLHPAVSVSAGVAGTPAGRSPADLEAQADQALYTAKRAGKNQVALAGRQ
jgi:diguanylate cyclase (GGDEF)-like protein